MERYIVTEQDLFDLASTYADPKASVSELNDIREKCRRFEVPEWATHFAGCLIAGYEFMEAKEIPE